MSPRDGPGESPDPDEPVDDQREPVRDEDTEKSREPALDEDTEKSQEPARDEDTERSPDSDPGTDRLDTRLGATKAPDVDPVQRAHGRDVDLYDIATWEPRSPLDHFAVRVTNGLRTARTTFLVALAFTLFFFQAAIAGVLILEEPILGLLAVLSVVPAALLAAYFWFGDPTLREPVSLLAITFVLSILFASFAAVVNSIFLPAFELLPLVGLPLFFFLIVGPIEETVKWLAIRVYAYRHDSFNTVVDGVVYGAVAGLGFAAIENLVYILWVSVEFGEQGAVIQQQYAIATAATRAFVGPGHVIFSAWAGFYLGLAKFNPDDRGPIVVKGLLIAAFIHALYNTLVTSLPLEGLAFPLFIVAYHGFWFALLYRKLAAYTDLYRRAGQGGI